MKPGPVALITGAAKRVGNVVARHLAEHGYRLAIHANTSMEEAQQFVTELKQSGKAAIAVQAEFQDPGAIRRMVEETIGAFGRIDALINCAAIWKPKPLEQITAADVREHFEVNTLSTFLCCQQVGLQMCEQPEGGAIVNFGDWAIERPYVDYAAYFASKGSIPTITRTFAVELAKRNPRVRVNAIMPGPVMLPQSIPKAEREAIIECNAGAPRRIARANRSNG